MTIKIFVVDDEPMIVDVLQAYLEREGYQVYSARNGAEALKQIKSCKPDFIILDLMLPDISGEQICREVRKESDVPIMMLTAKSAEEERIQGIVMGADDYITKPFSPREVVVRVQSILRRAKKLDKQDQFKKYILLAGITMTILSIIFGFLFSKRLTSGFSQLKQATRELQNHNLTERIPVNHLDLEIADLAMAFNELAETLNHEGNLRKQYIGDLAHELRTPLATLRSQVEAFQDGIWEPTAERLQQSHDELMRLVRLVKEFEQLAEAENPQIQLKVERIEAGKLMRTIIDRFQPSFDDKGINISFESSDSELWFDADVDRVQQFSLFNVVFMLHTVYGFVLWCNESLHI